MLTCDHRIVDVGGHVEG